MKNGNRFITFMLISENDQLPTSKRFLEEAERLGMSPVLHNPREQGIIIHDHFELIDSSYPIDGNTLMAHRCTGRQFDDFDLKLATGHQARGARIFNNPQSLIPLRDKELQQIWFQQHQLPSIPTISLRGCPQEKLWEVIDLHFVPFSPDQFILKTIRGNKGIGVNFINGRRSLKGLLETLHATGDQRYLLQPYLADAREYRFFICAGELLEGMEKRASAGDYRANAQRGEVAPLNLSTLSPEVETTLKTIIDRSGLFYMAVDFLIYKDQSFLLEINTIPGIQYIEELSKRNLAGHILQKAMQL